MDTANRPLITLSAAPAAPSPSPADSAAPPARADGSRSNRSFAATLARQQPKSAVDGNPPPADPATAAPADASSPPAAASATDSAPQDAKPATKPPGKPGAKPKAASDGDGAPAGGNALPLWLPPVPQVVAPAATTTAAVAAAAAAAPVTAPAAADAPGTVLSGSDLAAAQAATSAATPVPATDATSLATASADAEREATAASPSVSGPGSAPTVALPAAMPAAASAPIESRAATMSAAVQKAADAAALGSTPAPAPVAANRASPAELAASAPVASAVTAAVPKGARPATVSVEAPRSSAPAAEASTSMAPVATDLKQAVAAVLSTDTKGDAATTPTAKVAVDASAGVLPPAAGAAPERTAAPTIAQVSTPVGAPDWSHELADRVNVLVNQNLTHAQIKLSPADLGPIEVRIALADGQANVSFTTHSHVTSEALQAAAPRLREALSSQGYASVNVDVSQQQFRERAPQQTRYESEPTFSASAPQGVTRTATRLAGVATAASRLDAYA